MIVYGSGLSDGNRHTHEDLPVLMVGGGGGFAPRQPHRLSEGHADDEPLPLTMLQSEKIGDTQAG